MRSTLCTLFFFLIGSTGCINAESGTDFENTVLYMQKFGYIENAPLSYVSKNLFTEALKTVQKYGNIPTTGVLDEKTEKLIKSPRCGVKDVENLVYRKDNYKEPKSGKLYKLNSDGWWQREINYYISNSTVKLEENTVEDILRKAFDTWHGVSGLIFREVWMLPEADITIVFFRGGHSTPEMAEEAFDGPGKVLAHTSMPGSDGIKPTFVHFDEDEEWVSEAGEKKRCKPKGVDFFNVALHELGHALGLSHTFTEGSIMSPYFNSDNVQLGYADALGMYELYVRSRRFGEIGDVKKPDPIDYPPHPKDKLCDGNFDAALARYEELFLFKGKVVWRLWKNMIVGGRAFWIREIFHFPYDIEKIDAAYERRTDNKILFFIGDHYWIFDYVHPVINKPFRISSLGLPDELGSIDAALTSTADKTYFFKDNIYWCYNENLGIMEGENPRFIENWRITPSNFDASAGFINGTSYFFKGTKYWEVDDKGFFTNPENPRSTEEFCKFSK